MFKPAKLVKISCISPKKYTWQVISKLQDIGVVHISKAKLINDFKPVTLTDGNYNKISELLGIANNLIKLIESKTFKPFLVKFFGPKYIYVTTKKEFDIKKIEKNLKLLSKKYRALKYIKMPINLSDYNQLLLLRDLLNDKVEQYKALQLFSESKYLMRFQGWVEEEKAARVKNAMEIATKNACVFTINKPKRYENPPTLLRNPAIIKPFEIFTENYGVPTYREIDPTPIVALTFTLIFGLMFADFGYGLTLSALSLFVYLYTTKESKFRKNLNIVLIYLGLSSAFFGYFLGECFGIGLRETGIDPLSDITLFFMIAILIGLIHTSFALFAKIFANVNDKKTVLFAFSMLVAMWSAFSIYYIPNVLLNKILLITSILVILFIQQLEAFKEILSLFAGMISYIRIAILGIGHLIINRMLVSSYSALSGSFLEIILFIILFIIGSSIVLTLGIFVTIIQDIRLHWVEFFSKFFIGKGTKFKPFEHKVL